MALVIINLCGRVSMPYSIIIYTGVNSDLAATDTSRSLQALGGLIRRFHPLLGLNV